ncbi:hypothetical protein GBC55_005850 [Pseudomonas sp. TNT3]|nr:hypothetical protein [Pseudomonas sp. TNT3]KAI2693372.1 hypothetical protein GBC55_005850 [Pseudomonas sp. TNT3]
MYFVHFFGRDRENPGISLGLADECAEEEISNTIRGCRDKRAQYFVFVKCSKKIGFIVPGKELAGEVRPVGFGLQLTREVSLEVIQRGVFIQRSLGVVRQVHHAFRRRRGVDRGFGEHQRPADACIIDHQALPDYRRTVEDGAFGLCRREFLCNDAQHHCVNGFGDVLFQVGNMNGDFQIKQLQLPDVGR